MTVEKNKNNMVDFNFHGIVGLRLINPSEADVKVITRKFEQKPQALSSEPDIIITYKKNWQLSDLTFIGLNTAGYYGQDFYILSNGREDVKVIIPFEDIGNKQLNIICESGSPDVPGLNHVLNLTMISKGFLPLHSTAFRYNGKGALVMGWAKGGKSESLFSFMKNGAQYVSDEVSIVSDDGKTILGLKVPICIWEWQFKEIPEFMPKAGLQKKMIFMLSHFIIKMQKIINSKMLGKILPLFKSQLNLKALPSKLFKDDKIIEKTSFDKIILAMSYDSENIIVEKISTDEVADRMLASQMYELEYFNQFYNIFKYAFPGKKNDFIENIKDTQQKLMYKLLIGKDAYVVKHPYPVSFKALFDKMKVIFNDGTKTKNLINANEIKEKVN